MQETSQVVAPLTPAFVCWMSLVVTVVGLVVAFYYTNITAFARVLYDKTRKPAAGALEKHPRLDRQR